MATVCLSTNYPRNGSLSTQYFKNINPMRFRQKGKLLLTWNPSPLTFSARTLTPSYSLLRHTCNTLRIKSNIKRKSKPKFKNSFEKKKRNTAKRKSKIKEQIQKETQGERNRSRISKTKFKGKRLNTKSAKEIFPIQIPTIATTATKLLLLLLTSRFRNSKFQKFKNSKVQDSEC